MHDARCMIPRQVTTRIEFFPGIGIREVIASGIGAGLGYVLYRMSGMVIGDLSSTPALFVRFTIPILCPVLAFALVINGERSILNTQIRATRFNRNPRRLLFRVGSAAQGGSRMTASTWSSALSSLLGLLTGKPQRPASTGGVPQSVQQWLPVQDLPPGGLLVRRDGALVAAIRVEPRNITLLSQSERIRLLRGLRTAINTIGTPENQIISLPRPIDLDGYLRRLDATLPDLSPARQRLLRQYIRHVSDLIAGGEAQERHFYIMLSRPGGKGAADELRQQATDLADRLLQADLIAHVVDERALLNLLYAFHHPAQAAFERPQAAPYTTTLAGGN